MSVCCTLFSQTFYGLLFCYLTSTDVHVTLHLQIIDFQFPSSVASCYSAQVAVSSVGQGLRTRSFYTLRPSSYVAFLPFQIQFNELNATEIRRLSRLPHLCLTFDWPFRIIPQKCGTDSNVEFLNSKTWWCKGMQTKMLPINAGSVKDLISQK